jgi:hypothetical protein
MAQLTIIYWRDIPAQVIARTGRVSAKRELGGRFQEAIDRAAMKSGARDEDAYLAAWRRSDPVDCGADLEAAADAAVLRLENEYDASRLATLVAANGRAG